MRVESERSGIITATLDQAVNWWTRLWEAYGEDRTGCFANYRQQNDREWADDDLKALLVMLTRRRTSGGSPDCSGFRILRPLTDFHTSVQQDALKPTSSASCAQDASSLWTSRSVPPKYKHYLVNGFAVISSLTRCDDLHRPLRIILSNSTSRKPTIFSQRGTIKIFP